MKFISSPRCLSCPLGLYWMQQEVSFTISALLAFVDGLLRNYPMSMNPEKRSSMRGKEDQHV